MALKTFGPKKDPGPKPPGQKKTLEQRVRSLELNVASHEGSVHDLGDRARKLETWLPRERLKRLMRENQAVELRPKMTRYTVEILHHDSPQRYKHFGVTAVVNGPSWVELYKGSGEIVMFPKEEVFRLRLEVEK